MARTKEQIFQNLITRKNADSVLSLILTSESKASFYQSLFALYADVTGDFELTFDAFQARINNLLDAKQVQTSAWWRRSSLGFQLGDALSTNASGNLVYNPVVAANQIVKRAAVIVTAAGNITLKVAKLQNNLPVPLISSENSAFREYVNDIGPAGVVVTIVSETGDEIRVAVAVEVDSQIINVSNGQLLSDSSVKPVERAINNYFATFQSDDFGGTFFANKLLQNILATSGVINATLTTLEQKASGQGTFTNVLTASGKKFLTFAGYVRLADGFDLSANITYTAG